MALALQSAHERAERSSMMTEDIRGRAITEDILNDVVKEVGLEQHQMIAADVESHAFAVIEDICLHWFFDFGLILGRYS